MSVNRFGFLNKELERYEEILTQAKLSHSRILAEIERGDSIKHNGEDILPEVAAEVASSISQYESLVSIIKSQIGQA